MKDKWDQKAKTYAKFNGELSEFSVNLFGIINEFWTDFRECSVLDIGAGTGVYSLYLATLGAKVTALDSSAAMLGELERSAKEHDIRIQNIVNASFRTFYENVRNHFDIAFLTMSPALQTSADFDAFLDIAERKIYVNWASGRDSSMLAPLFAHFGVNKSSLGLTTRNFEAHLKAKNIPYKAHLLSEKRMESRTLEKAVENAIWHLEVSGVTANNSDVRALLENQVKNGIITDEINAVFKAFFI